jgi:hypothetical protein
MWPPVQLTRRQPRLRAAGAFVCAETELEKPMNRQSEQYRFARVEAYHTTVANLEKQFRDRAIKPRRDGGGCCGASWEGMALRTLAQIGKRACRLPGRHATCWPSVSFAVPGGVAKPV